MTKNWQATWIEPQQEPTRKEPPFSLADMFSGKKLCRIPRRKVTPTTLFEKNIHY